MYHFAFFMMPEPGHVLPSLRVATSLIQKGHTVSYVSLPALEHYLSQQGFHVHTILKSTLPIPAVATEDLLTLPEGTITEAHLSTYVGMIGRRLPELIVDELHDVPFDLLVCDSWIIHICGEEIQKSLGRPIVSLSPSLPGSDRRRLRSVPEIVLCPRELEIPSSICTPEHTVCDTCYAEPSLSEARAHRVPSTIFVDKHLIYCSLGTQTLRYRDGRHVLTSIADAVSTLDSCQMMIWSNNQRLLSSVSHSPNVQLLQNGAQVQILRMSSIFISHGGLGGLKESIMYGVPLVVIPFDLDQPGNAARVAHHGLGYCCLPSHCTADTIREMITRLLADREAQCRVNQMGRVFWKYEVAAPASDFIIQSADSMCAH